MNTLLSLYEEHKGKASDKWLSYLMTYEKLFSPYRERPIRLLEIGVQNGGSLEIWSQYFPNAEALVGVDINPDCAKLVYGDKRIEVFVGDANSGEIEGKILNTSQQFDIIIDDGSHTSSDIVQSFSRYFPHLALGGLFVAEDLHCSYWQSYEGGVYYPYSSMSFFKRLADIVNHEYWGTGGGRADVVASFARHYGASFNEDELAAIHAVQFFNSICSIEKKAESFNILGPRHIAGSEELVVGGHCALKNQILVAPKQDNFWSMDEQSPEAAWSRLNDEIKMLSNRLSQIETELLSLRSSKSWRLTRPLRVVAYGLRMMVVAIKNGQVLELFRTSLLVVLSEGPRGLVARVRSKISSVNTYNAWVEKYDVIDDRARIGLARRCESLSGGPLISLILPTYNSNTDWLASTIDSVVNQIYPKWELCIADDASSNPAVKALVEEYARADSRIKYTLRSENGHISEASNSALTLATGQWVALLDHDDLLREHSLVLVVDAISRHSGCALVYSDEDKIDLQNNRHDPYFKSDWNRELFYAQNFICHLGVYRKDVADKIGGFRRGFEGAQDYDFALRFIEHINDDQIVHIPHILYHWRAHPDSTAGDAQSKPYALVNSQRALQEHLSRMGESAEVAVTEYNHLRARYELPVPQPMVSIIIPTKNQYVLLVQCIDSILEKTTYSNYEIIVVDNGSDERLTLDYLESFSGSSRVRVLRDDSPFNFSALNNSAVRVAQGEYVCLVNNDIEVISPGWLGEMLSYAAKPGRGAVGARLWYPDETIQHAGVIVGIGGVAGHAHKHLAKNDPGYFARAVEAHELSAVTAACLLVKKKIYEEVGGLDESNLAVAFNDIDFCLKVGAAGYRNVWTPFAELYHHESASRGYEDSLEKIKRFNSEVAFMKKKWGDSLLRDPAYNPNLTLEAEDFGLSFPPRVSFL